MMKVIGILFCIFYVIDIRWSIGSNSNRSSVIVNMLVTNDEGKFTSENLTDVGKFQASYSVLKNDAGEKYAILFFPYFQDVSFAESELNVFLSTLYQIYFIMLVVTIVLAYFISRFVTRSIETIRTHMKNIRRITNSSTIAEAIHKADKQHLL